MSKFVAAVTARLGVDPAVGIGRQAPASRVPCGSCGTTVDDERYAAYLIRNRSSRPYFPTKLADVCADCAIYHLIGHEPETWTPGFGGKRKWRDCWPGGTDKWCPIHGYQPCGAK